MKINAWLKKYQNPLFIVKGFVIIHFFALVTFVQAIHLGWVWTEWVAVFMIALFWLMMVIFGILLLREKILDRRTPETVPRVRPYQARIDDNRW